MIETFTLDAIQPVGYKLQIKIIMKKKKLILLIVILILSIHSYSQNSNELRIYYGISDGKLLEYQDFYAGNYEYNTLNEFGVKYLRQIKNNFSIELGLNFLKLDIKNEILMFPTGVLTDYEKLEIVSIPIYANYTFWKYLFVNGGPILDFQTSDNLNNSPSTSGIGYSIGIGGKYDFDKFLIFVNPNYKRHSVIPFKKENYPRKLTEFGIQFGVGYKF